MKKLVSVLEMDMDARGEVTEIVVESEGTSHGDENTEKWESSKGAKEKLKTRGI